MAGSGAAGARVSWHYRLATAADAARLAVLDASLSVDPWSRTQWEAACNAVDDDAVPRREVLLALQGYGAGEMVQGFAVLSRILDEATLESLAVVPSWR